MEAMFLRNVTTRLQDYMVLPPRKLQSEHSPLFTPQYLTRSGILRWVAAHSENSRPMFSGRERRAQSNTQTQGEVNKMAFSIVVHVHTRTSFTDLSMKWKEESLRLFGTKFRGECLNITDLRQFEAGKLHIGELHIWYLSLSTVRVIRND
jgi:hypothetical protein